MGYSVLEYLLVFKFLLSCYNDFDLMTQAKGRLLKLECDQVSIRIRGLKGEAVLVKSTAVCLVIVSGLVESLIIITEHQAEEGGKNSEC